MRGAAVRPGRDIRGGDAIRAEAAVNQLLAAPGRRCRCERWLLVEIERPLFVVSCNQSLPGDAQRMSVFLSYASEDKETADQVCERLESRGITCWYAPRDIPAGANFPASIAEAVEKSSILVVLFSAHSDKSRHVARELHLADQCGTSILPVRIADVSPTGGLDYYIGNAQWFNATGRSKNVWLEELASLVEARLVGMPLSSGASTRKTKRWLIWIALPTGVVVIALLYFLGVATRCPDLPEAVRIYTHPSDLDARSAGELGEKLIASGLSVESHSHISSASPDAMFFGFCVRANAARLALSLVPYEVRYLFPPDYPEGDGGSRDGLLIGIGYRAGHVGSARTKKSVAVEVTATQLDYLTRSGLSDSEFQDKLASLTRLSSVDRWLYRLGGWFHATAQ